MLDRPIHPACAQWPRPSDEEVRDLAKSIKAEGLHNSIWLMPDGAIIDGKTRYEACQTAGVEPRFETYTGDDPIGFTISQNERRRHLSKTELALIAEELARLKHGSNQHRKVDAFAKASMSAEQAMNEIGSQLGVSRTHIQAARTIKKHGEPNIIEFAKAEKVALQAAAAFAFHMPREAQRMATVDVVRKRGNEFKKGGAMARGGEKPPKSEPMLTIPRRDVIDKLRPLIKRVKEQSKRHAATVSFTELSIIAHALAELADEWMKNGPEVGTASGPVPINTVHKGG